MRHFQAFTALALLVAGCGDDSAGPPGTITFPGDAATLQEAVDSARPGETVEIAPGTHAIGARLVVGPSDIRIVGAASPLRGSPAAVLDYSLDADNDKDAIAIDVEGSGVTIENLEIRGTFRHGVRFTREGGALRGCRIEGGLSFSVWCPNPLVDAVIEGNVIVRPGVFGVSCQGGASPLVERNTIIEAGDCGIYSSFSSPLCRRNIVYAASNFGIACFDDPFPTLECNDVFASVNADWFGCAQGADDISADPLFCGDGTYRLQPESPCAAANAGACGSMGAVGEVCPGR